jgi:hypothetical protein
MAISVIVCGPDGFKLTVNGVAKARPLTLIGNRYVVNLHRNTFVAKGPGGQVLEHMEVLSQSDSGKTIRL